MSQRLIQPNKIPVGSREGVAPIEKGGTGATTREQAIENLQGIPVTALGESIVQLDSKGLVPLKYLPADVALEDTIEGPTSIVRGTSAQYRLTLYDQTVQPVVSIDRGVVSVVNDTITVRAPSDGDAVNLTINRRTIRIPLSVAGANPAVMTYPNDGSRIRGAVNFRLQQFASNVETYTAWVQRTTNGALAVPPDASYLEIRGRRGEAGVGSVDVEGARYNIGVSQSQVRIPVSAGSVAFLVNSAAKLEYRWVVSQSHHTSTDWEVATDASFTDIVASSIQDTENLTEWQASLPEGDYHVRARMNAEILISGTIMTPSITHPTPDFIVTQPSFTAQSSVFTPVDGFDIHASSDWEIATDATFTSVVRRVTASTSFLTALNISGLGNNADYYIRVRYNGQTNDASSWSPGVKFRLQYTVQTLT